MRTSGWGVPELKVRANSRRREHRRLSVRPPLDRCLSDIPIEASRISETGHELQKASNHRCDLKPQDEESTEGV